MGESLPSGEIFRSHTVDLRLSNEEFTELNQHLHGLVNDFNASEVIKDIEYRADHYGNQVEHTSFRVYDMVYVRSADVIGWKDTDGAILFGRVLDSPTVIYADGLKDSPPLYFGAIDLHTGKAILLFEGIGLHHLHTDFQGGENVEYLEDYGFIYDPSQQRQSADCLILGRSNEAESYHNQLRILDELASRLADSKH
jgi:hypothetical protein